MFQPNYGAASSHIETLMSEREDFIEVNMQQAARIKALEAQVADLTDDLQSARTQAEHQALIAQNRAREYDDLEEVAEQQASKINKLRTALRLLWGTNQSLHMRTSEQLGLIAESNELLESLDDLLLVDGKRRQEPASPEGC